MLIQKASFKHVCHKEAAAAKPDKKQKASPMPVTC